MHNKSTHLFHIMNPAPWPFLVSMTLFNVLMGMILWLNKYIMSSDMMLMSFAILFFVVQQWFIDMVSEASYEGKHSSVVQNGLKLGMMLFMVSEVMFFFGFFWAYFHFSLSPSIEMGCLWPPYGIQVFNYLHVPLYNTFVLLLSGVCVTWFHHNIFLKKNMWSMSLSSSLSFSEELLLKKYYAWFVVYIMENHYNMYSKVAPFMMSGESFYSLKVYPYMFSSNLENNIMALILTILLAMHFTYFQLQEYTEASFNMSDSVYGSIFFMATGFHGFHVMLGTCFLMVCFGSLLKGHFGSKHHLGLEFAMWYWHFVDVVWLFLYVCVYWWASTSLI